MKPIHLFNAIQSHDLNEVLAVLKAGVDPNAQHRGNTPLCFASAYGKPEIVAALLAAGADPNSTNKRGDTALCIASVEQRVVIFSVLLKAGADPELLGMNWDHGDPEFHAALSAHYLKIDAAFAARNLDAIVDQVDPAPEPLAIRRF